MVRFSVLVWTTRTTVRSRVFPFPLSHWCLTSSPPVWWAPPLTCLCLLSLTSWTGRWSSVLWWAARPGMLPRSRPWTMFMGSLLLMMCLPETGNWRGMYLLLWRFVIMTLLQQFRFRNGGQWLLGKAMEAFAPIGPAVVSKDVIGDPNNLNLSCKVNGETKQVWEQTFLFLLNISQDMCH